MPRLLSTGFKTSTEFYPKYRSLGRNLATRENYQVAFFRSSRLRKEKNRSIPVPDPDLEIRGGPGLQKIFCRPFGPQLGLKIRETRTPHPPLDPPLNTEEKSKTPLIFSIPWNFTFHVICCCCCTFY